LARKGQDSERQRMGAYLGHLGGLSGSANGQEARHALPPPESTDPVALGLMQGFPPQPDKLTKLPNGRWAFHHLSLELNAT